MRQGARCSSKQRNLVACQGGALPQSDDLVAQAVPQVFQMLYLPAHYPAQQRFGSVDHYHRSCISFVEREMPCDMEDRQSKE
jgi:hypothetical protein